MARRSVVYRSSPDIAWVKDAELTLLVHEQDGRSWTLWGLEAAIWDLMILAHPFPEIVRMVSLLAGCETQAAAERVTSLLQEWEEQGIVCAVEDVDLERGVT